MKHDQTTDDDHSKFDEWIYTAAPPDLAIYFLERPVEAIHVGTDLLRPSIQAEPWPEFLICEFDTV